MIKLVPAILSKTRAEFQEKINLLRELTNEVHLDVTDGEFVPNETVAIEKISPLPQDFTYYIHLMVKRPIKVVDKFLAQNPKAIFFHIEAESHPQELIEKIKNQGSLGGLVLNPETKVKKIESFLENTNMVLVMTVNPGASGQKFNPVPLEKVRELKKLKPDLLMAVDGGVNRENILQIAASGADFIFSASAVFKDNKVRENIETLKSALRS